MRLGGPWAWLLGLPTAVVYGSLALFVSVLHNVFLLYYVDTFVSVYKIDKAAFWVGETVFLLWNSLNDPLFGWLSDRQFLSSQPRNRVFTEGTCKLLTLVVTDLVDEDLVLNHRKQAASALLFGMVALVTKPGQTFAPLLGTWLLCFYTGHDLFQQHPPAPVGSAQPWPEPPAPPPAQAPPLRQGCFYLLVLVPIACALLQLFTWSQFTLHGRRLHMVKAQRQSLSRAQTLDVKMV